MMPLEIREYTHDDANKVAELYNKCSFYHAEYGYQISESDIITSFKERGTYILVVALYEESVVGVLGCFPVSGQKVAEEGEAYIGSLLVHPEYRGGTLIKSLYAEMITKVVEKQIKCISTEIFPSNGMSLRLANRTGYVFTDSCKVDMDNYIDLKSYLPATLQCFYTTEEGAEANEGAIADIYNLGFSLLYTKEQQKQPYLFSEYENENREIIVYPIRVENAEYVLKVDVMSKSVYSLECEDFKICTYTEGGVLVKQNQNFDMAWEIQNKSKEELLVEMTSTWKGKKFPLIMDKRILAAEESKTYSKQLKRKKAGKHNVATNVHIKIGDRKDYYLRLGLGIEVKQESWMELQKFNFSQNEILLTQHRFHEQQHQIEQVDEICLKYDDTTCSLRKIRSQAKDFDQFWIMAKKKLCKNFFVDGNEKYSLIRFDDFLFVRAKGYQLKISLRTGMVEIYSSEGTLTATDLWPAVRYPHISGHKCELERRISFEMQSDRIILLHQDGELRTKRELILNVNTLKVVGDVYNSSSKEIKGSIGKIQPWLEWMDAQMIAPSRGKVFIENLIYNSFPLGISDMIVGDINEFSIDTKENGAGWVAYACRNEYIKYSWKSSKELRFGQRWMPCIMFQMPGMKPYSFVELPEYQIEFYQDNSFLQEEGTLYEYIYLERGQVHFEEKDSECLEGKLEVVLRTFSNFNLRSKVTLELADIDEVVLYQKEYSFDNFNCNTDIKVMEGIEIPVERQGCFLYLKVRYEDVLRIREFKQPMFCSKSICANTQVNKKEDKYYEKFLVNNDKLALEIVPEYAQSITSLKYYKDSRLITSYPKFVQYEAEEKWSGGISNYIIPSSTDKLGNMLKPEERLSDLEYEVIQEKDNDCSLCGIVMQGYLKNKTVRNKIQYVLLGDHSILALQSEYQLQGNGHKEFESIFSFYPKLFAQYNDEYNIYYKSFVNGKEILVGSKKMNAVSVAQGVKYVVLEDLHVQCYFVICCTDIKNQVIYLNHLKSGLNICIAQKICLNDKEPVRSSILVGCFKTKKEALFFGEHANRLNKKRNYK